MVSTANGTKSRWPFVLGALGRDVSALCKGDERVLSSWLDADAKNVTPCLIWLVTGAGVYEASLGMWRSPLQAGYVAIKFPLLILLTAAGNCLINGMLAQLLGVRISWRQSFLAVLMSFALFSIIVGSLAPMSIFVAWNTPDSGSESSRVGYAALLLMHVVTISVAGVVSNIRLFRLLTHLCDCRRQALRVLGAWLARNAILGCQLSWNLRPFLGTPESPVTFFRAHPFSGNFIEAVINHASNLFTT